MMLFALQVCFIGIIVNAKQPPVLKESDPNKYWKLNAAFSGYDIIKGEPMPVTNAKTDIGIRNEIFVPVRFVNQHYEWDGVSVRDSLSCQASLMSKVVTTAKAYRNFIGRNSQVGAGFGGKGKISVEASDPSLMFTIKPEYEISIKNAFSHSPSSVSADLHLSETNSAISLTYAECITETVLLQGFSLPRFTKGFNKGIIALAKASKMPQAVQKKRFQMFMTEFGTHYMTQVIMGARMVEAMKFKSKLRPHYDLKTTQDCSSTGSNINVLWFNVSSCSKEDHVRFGKDGSMVQSWTMSTYGSKPGDDIKKWAEQDFAPNPLSMELMPIVNLFAQDILEDQGINVDYQALLDWVLPMYINYGLFMGLDLRPPMGCGESVDCPFNESCVSLDNHKGNHLCVPFNSTDSSKKQGWYLNTSISSNNANNSNGGRVPGILSTWYTSAKNCCASGEPYSSCRYNVRSLWCAVTYNVDVEINPALGIKADTTDDFSNTVYFFFHTVSRTNPSYLTIYRSSWQTLNCADVCKHYQDHHPRFHSCKKQSDSCLIEYDGIFDTKSGEGYHYFVYQPEKKFKQ